MQRLMPMWSLWALHPTGTRRSRSLVSDHYSRSIKYVLIVEEERPCKRGQSLSIQFFFFSCTKLSWLPRPFSRIGLAADIGMLDTYSDLNRYS